MTPWRSPIRISEHRVKHRLMMGISPGPSIDRYRRWKHVEHAVNLTTEALRRQRKIPSAASFVRRVRQELVRKGVADIEEATDVGEQGGAHCQASNSMRIRFGIPCP